VPTHSVSYLNVRGLVTQTQMTQHSRATPSTRYALCVRTSDYWDADPVTQRDPPYPVEPAKGPFAVGSAP
jgi:hypothetical protein